MLLTYVRRELTRRRRQTIVVAVGLALAVALAMIVNAVSTGVRDAQSAVLDSVYGVGTDVTITQAAEPGSGRTRFDFGGGDGSSTEDGGTALATERLDVRPGSSAIAASVLDTAAGVDGVAAASATLELTATSFSGELPAPPDGTTGVPGQGDEGLPADPRGGFGGGAFDIATTDVEGVEPGATALGALTLAELAEGRPFEAADADRAVALLSTTYAEAEALAVGDTVTVGGTDAEVVGLLTSDGEAGSLADVYLPLSLAQQISGLTDQVTTVYVQADSADAVEEVAAELESALPDATVSTEADLAASVTGSLSSAASLVENLGRWLSVIVLAAAFVLAVLFTVSGVTRRTRDFGTLKAIGWSNGRIVRQVGVESLVQGALGAVAGLALGLAGIGVVNALGLTLTGSAGGFSFAGAPQPPDGADVPGGGALPDGGGGAFGGAADAFGQASSAVDVVLSAPVSLTVIGLGVALAVLGGLLAGSIGGWRAARLRPAAALRSVD